MKKIKATIPSSKNDFLKKIPKNISYPDKVEQIDKVINKYKKQLERLKPQKNSYEDKIQHYLSFNRKNNRSTGFINNDSEPNTCRYSRNNKKNIQYYQTVNNEIHKVNKKDKENYNNKYHNRYKLNENNKYKCNNNLYKSINKNKNLSYDLNYEIEKDNIQLGTALTLEKGKVLDLLNLLKVKDDEINDLKKQIENFEIKINSIENKYQRIINTVEDKKPLQLNNLYSNRSNKNIILNDDDYNEIKKNNDIQLNQINNELNKDKKIIQKFFDLFNKNIDLINKTEILNGKKISFINSNNYNEDNALLAVEALDKLINKLVQDNKDLYNEFVRLNGEINNKNMIMGNNNNCIKKEINSLRQVIQNLASENNNLRKSKSFFNLNTANSINSQLSPRNTNNCLNNREIKNCHHHHIVHSICRHCTQDCFTNNEKNIRGNVSPFDKVKVQINELEKKIRNRTNC